MRDQLVGFQGLRAVIGAGDDLLGLRHRRIGQPQQRFLDQVEDDEDVHRHIARKPRRPDLARQAEPAIDLHRAGVAALHLGKELRGVLLLDKGATDAAHPEVDRQGQSDRPGSDDDDLRVQCGICLAPP